MQERTLLGAIKKRLSPKCEVCRRRGASIYYCGDADDIALSFIIAHWECITNPLESATAAEGYEWNTEQQEAI